MIPTTKAATVNETFGAIDPPSQIALLKGLKGINALLDNVVGIFFAAAALSFIIMFVWGATQMILSGGEKEAVGKARAKITWAIIGIVLMSLSYFIFQLLEAVTGFQFFV